MKLKTFWERLVRVLRQHISLTIIVVAALLLELTTGVQNYYAQSMIQNLVESYIGSEMRGNSLQIQNQLAKVEVAVNNMVWVVERQLQHPDSMYTLARCLVENNPDILGSSITFVPDYYPQKGHWFEPYAARRAGGTVEMMQLGSADHDYTKQEFFVAPVTQNSAHWCEPYLDSDGAKTMVTTYAVPVHDASGKTACVVDADLSIGWLGEIINTNKRYATTQRILMSRDGQVLAGNQDLAKMLHVDKLLQDDPDHNGYLTMADEAGEKLHIYYNPVGGLTDWTMVYVCYDSDIFGKLNRIRIILLLMALAGLALISFIVYRTSRHLEHLRQVNAEKERIGSELRVAKGIQQSMLPEGHLQQDGVEICGSLVPAREVGGDLYDYFIRDGKLFFCIGDVSGKGVPSAMVMSVVHSLFRMASAHENNPAHIMQIVNETLCEGNESNMFVTLFMGILELSTGRLCYCNAGHDAPVVLNEAQTAKNELLDVKPNLPLGLYDDFAYEMQESTLVGGSMLFLYTDGLTEAKNNQRKLFGMDRVMTMLQGTGNLLPEQLLTKMAQAVHNFVEEAPQSDDLTMLAIKFTPVSFNMALDEQLTLQNDIRQVPKLNDFVKDALERVGVGVSLIKQMQLAVEEAVVNVMEYAYPVGETNDILLQISSDGQYVRFVIKDRGVAFDPTAKKKADTTLSVEDRPIGGLGILLVREIMDSVSYERTDGMNVLSLTKKIK